jgi:hypothetical protein
MATIEADTIKALQDRQMEEAQLPDSEVIETEETAEEERTMPGIGRHQRAELTTFDEVEDRTSWCGPKPPRLSAPASLTFLH